MKIILRQKGRPKFQSGQRQQGTGPSSLLQKTHSDERVDYSPQVEEKEAYQASI